MKQIKSTWVRCEVEYINELALKVSDFMSKMDLGLEGVHGATREAMRWKTTSKVDGAYKKDIKEGLENKIKKSGGKVIDIKISIEDNETV